VRACDRSAGRARGHDRAALDSQRESDHDLRDRLRAARADLRKARRSPDGRCGTKSEWISSSLRRAVAR
jgi:hypothetical protein